MNSIERRIQERAVQTLRCLPFNDKFYLDCKSEGLSAGKTFQEKTDYCAIGLNWFKGINDVEAAFLWLIKVGVLRREVDGQGLTSSIRLTPLGREILEKRSELFSKQATIFERIQFWLYRNLRLR